MEATILAYDKGFVFYCPGCEGNHFVQTTPGNDGEAVWTWNGVHDRPTISPSLLIRYPASGDYPALVCHLFLRDGLITYLEDCTHPLKGQTVPIPEWSGWDDDPPEDP